MGTVHNYALSVEWTGNRGDGTSSYRAYSRDHLIVINRKPTLSGSSDPAFLGDPEKHNPEDLLLASLSACHMLWYLHLCASAGIIVVSYKDNATGCMEQTADGKTRFSSVTLNPHITIAAGDDLKKADALHHDAHEACFIANSVNFPVHCDPSISFAAPA